jgi:hypothetical protein
LIRRSPRNGPPLLRLFRRRQRRRARRPQDTLGSWRSSAVGGSP